MASENTTLKAALESLEAGASDCFERFLKIFDVQYLSGECKIPASFAPKVQQWFTLPDDVAGSVDDETIVNRARNQQCICIFNRFTCETALFNPARSARPITAKPSLSFQQEIQDCHGVGKCDFCDPLAKTTADTWGRIDSTHCLTASNVAKFCGCHGMIVLKEHHPLSWNRDVVADALMTAEKWHETSHEAHSECQFPITIWNCLRKSGGSQLHGHLQMLLFPRRYPGTVEMLLRVAQQFWNSEHCDYFQELMWCHHALGMDCTLGDATAFAHIAARKEREIIVLAKDLSDSFMDLVFVALSALRDELGVACFNFALYHLPFAEKQGSKAGPPQYVVARMVDRGDPTSVTSDWGAVEMFAGAAVITADPMTTANALKRSLSKFTGARALT